MIQFLIDNWDPIWRAFLLTARLSLYSFVIALAIGMVIASFRVSPIPPLQRFATFYVSIFRNTPLLVVFFLFYFGFPKLGIQFPGFPSAVIVLSAYTGAYLGEAIRSGINAVAVGQAEAARAIGLNFTQLLGVIVLPQALRTVVAPIGNLFIANAKNTSIALSIGVNELTSVSRELGQRQAQIVDALLGAGLLYVVALLAAGAVFGWIETRVAIKR